MHKFDGLKLASFILGVGVPLVVIVFMLQRNVSTSSYTTVVETKEVAASYIDTFAVDYDMYGSMFVGESFIRCTIANNSSNTEKCIVYLANESGDKISSEKELLPASSISVMDMMWSNDTLGEHKVKLIYEVETKEGKSLIQCPYVILLNGGKDVITR